MPFAQETCQDLAIEKCPVCIRVSSINKHRAAVRLKDGPCLPQSTNPDPTQVPRNLPHGSQPEGLLRPRRGCRITGLPSPKIIGPLDRGLACGCCVHASPRVEHGLHRGKKIQLPKLYGRFTIHNHNTGISKEYNPCIRFMARWGLFDESLRTCSNLYPSNNLPRSSIRGWILSLSFGGFRIPGRRKEIANLLVPSHLTHQDTPSILKLHVGLAVRTSLLRQMCS